MQEDQSAGSIRSDLLERLKALEEDGPGSGSLAELAYRRARDALEKALEEARTIRLQAIEDARASREREMTALLESLRGLRESAEAKIDALLREADIEAERTRSRAAEDARSMLEDARAESERLRDEAAAVRAEAERRRGEMQRMEAEFNASVAELAERIGVTEKPGRGWWYRLTHHADGTPKK